MNIENKILFETSEYCKMVSIIDRNLNMINEELTDGFVEDYNSNGLRTTTAKLNEINNTKINKTLDNYTNSQLLTLWNGLVCHESGKFSVIAKHIFGPRINFLQKELQDTLKICGRIKHEILYNYINEVMICSKNTVSIVFLDWALEEKAQYEKFFNYFNKRNRYAVCKIDSKTVKNFYLIPVILNGYLPEVFKLVKKTDQFIKHVRRMQPNALLGIIISNLHDVKSLVSFDPRINRK